MASQLFKTKSPERLMREAAAPERQMKRSLTALDLTALGIGAIIGTGIFALTGTAAAGEQASVAASKLGTPVLNFIQSWVTNSDVLLGRPGAGPGAARSDQVGCLPSKGQLSPCTKPSRQLANDGRHPSSRFAFPFEAPRSSFIITTAADPAAIRPRSGGTRIGRLAPSASASAGGHSEPGAGSSSTIA